MVYDGVRGRVPAPMKGPDVSKLSVVAGLLRVRHWIKNVLVLFPVVFGGTLLSDGRALGAAVAGFFAVSLVASGVYVVNDIRDVERDRAHPVKRRRPIASGAVPVRAAAVVAAALLAAGLAVDLAFVGPDPAPVACLAAYVALNLGYSLGLKNVPIADVTILAAGYLIRVLYGSCATGIAISSWMYLTVLSLSFYLGLGKRKGELDAAAGGPVRPVVAKYPADFLSSNMTVFFALGLVFYSLWATDAGTVAATSGAMVLTIPIVFVICLRYSLVMGREGQGDPIEVVLGDRPLMAMLAAFAAAVLLAIYAG